MPEAEFTERRERPSKSAAKRAHKALQALAEQLCRLKEDKLARLDLPERLRDELDVARSMKPSAARNRQLRFLTNLLTDLTEEDRAELERTLNRQ